MTMTIDLVRFFDITIKTVERAGHPDEFWLVAAETQAIETSGATLEGIDAAITGENFAQFSAADTEAILHGGGSHHDSLDFIEPSTARGMAYVFTLPTSGPVGGKQVDLKFLPTTAVATRIHPSGSSYISAGNVFGGGKKARIAIDRVALNGSPIGRALLAKDHKRMRVSVGLNIYDAEMGVTTWSIAEDPTDPISLADELHAFWHGGPHPPTNTSITVPLG